jgi:hypothetical protein
VQPKPFPLYGVAQSGQKEKMVDNFSELPENQGKAIGLLTGMGLDSPENPMPRL